MSRYAFASGQRVKGKTGKRDGGEFLVPPFDLGMRVRVGLPKVLCLEHAETCLVGHPQAEASVSMARGAQETL